MAERWVALRRMRACDVTLPKVLDVGFGYREDGATVAA